MGCRRERFQADITMKNVLHELYDGELSRSDLTFERGTPYARAFESVTATEEALVSTLSKEQKGLLEAHLNAVESLNAIARREDFASGFQIGARIMAAILNGENGNTRHDSRC